MPLWTNSPIASINYLIPGVPAYSAGSKNQTLPTTRMFVTNSAVASNVVTLTVKIVEGNIPSVGDTAFIYATTGNSGAFNSTSGRTLTGVTITAATGVGTITFAQTTADLSIAADVGYVISLVPEVAETLTTNQAYAALAMPAPGPPGTNRSITLHLSYPSAPTTISWAVQGALNNIDAEYVTIFSGAAAGTFSDSGTFAGTGQTTEFWPGAWRFIRFKDTGSSGGSSPTVVAAIVVT